MPANADDRESHAAHRVPHDDNPLAFEPHRALRIGDVVKLAGRVIGPMIDLLAVGGPIVKQFVGRLFLAPAIDVLGNLDHVEFDRAGSRRELLPSVRRVTINAGMIEVAARDGRRAIQIRRKNYVASANVRRLRHPCYPSMPASFLNASRSELVPCLKS